MMALSFILANKQPTITPSVLLLVETKRTNERTKNELTKPEQAITERTNVVSLEEEERS